MLCFFFFLSCVNAMFVSTFFCMADGWSVLSNIHHSQSGFRLLTFGSMNEFSNQQLLNSLAPVCVNRGQSRAVSKCPSEQTVIFAIDTDKVQATGQYSWIKIGQICLNLTLFPSGSFEHKDLWVFPKIAFVSIGLSQEDYHRGKRSITKRLKLKVSSQR